MIFKGLIIIKEDNLKTFYHFRRTFKCKVCLNQSGIITLKIRICMKRSIQDKIKSFFQKSETATRTDKKNKAFSKVLTRSDDFLAHYNNWKISGEASMMLKLLRATVEGSAGPEDSSPRVDFYSLPGAKGLSVYGLQATDHGNYRFLMDLLKERLLDMDYRLYSSTSEKKSSTGDVIITERHYLKPAVRSSVAPMDQLFGNILIELEVLNDKGERLKLLATHYTGFDYKPVRNFDDLIVNLLEG
jgi:hypothetical protein